MARNNSGMVYRPVNRPEAGGSDGRPLHSEGALAGIKLANEKLESEKAALVAKLAENKQEIEDLKTQLTAAKELELKLESATLAAEKLEKDVAVSKACEAKASAEIVETKRLLYKAAAKASSEAELDAMKAAKAACEAELDAVKAAKAASEAELDAVKAAKAAGEAELNAVKAAKAACEAELDETRKDLIASKVEEKSWRRAAEWFVARLPYEVKNDFLDYRGIDMIVAMGVLMAHEMKEKKKQKKKKRKEKEEEKMKKEEGKMKKEKEREEKQKEREEKEREEKEKTKYDSITSRLANLRDVLKILNAEVMDLLQDPSPARPQICDIVRMSRKFPELTVWDLTRKVIKLIEYLRWNLRSASPEPEIWYTGFNQQGHTRHSHIQYEERMPVAPVTLVGPPTYVPRTRVYRY